ncbi:hypothetical protein B6A42_13215 [Vibrio coralliilyticus]|nr:hypothetical protein B6A42_13215 [Vibrio coralliilyticus]
MRTATQAYEFNGVRGLSAIAKANGVPLGTLKGRIRKGLTLEQAIRTGDLRELNAGQSEHEWNGAKGVREIAKKVGVSQQTIFNYLKQGRTIDQAVACIKASKAKVVNARKPKRVSKKTVGIKFPDLMSPVWRLALGIVA